MNVLLSGQESENATSIILATHKPGEGPPPHFHAGQDECFFVLEGEYELFVAGQTHRAGPGTLVFLPRNTVHGFRNIGPGDARMLDWSLPAGQDRYFRTVHAQQTDGSFNPENMGELSRQFDTYFPTR
ncbi:cupin domain-containing protein [Paraburkholderia sp. SOS3]|uniref:cupin domain-containing protein n=1 Tax=Paraburkholderia sp. SOS3 TaxID=1926494 RepID=UPI001E618D4D|nr:cupin domain-containing protein [Paraburkholderia sp. SOS3]